MTRIEAFITPSELFGIVSEVVTKNDARLVFQRFETPRHDAGFTIVDPNTDVLKLYEEGGYSVAYITLGGLPESPTDWGFIDREQDHLIEIVGAIRRDMDLSITNIRVVSKRSRAKNACELIRRRISRSCDRGVSLDGHPYPKIYCENGIQEAGFELWTDVENKTIRAQPLADGSRSQ